MEIRLGIAIIANYNPLVEVCVRANRVALTLGRHFRNWFITDAYYETHLKQELI